MLPPSPVTSVVTPSRDLGGDALCHLGQHPVVDQHALLGLAEHIDEPGRDDEPADVQRLAGLGAVQETDDGEAVTPDRDIPAIARVAAAVHDPAVAQEQVVGTGAPAGRHRQGDQEPSHLGHSRLNESG